MIRSENTTLSNRPRQDKLESKLRKIESKLQKTEHKNEKLAQKLRESQELIQLVKDQNTELVTEKRTLLQENERLKKLLMNCCQEIQMFPAAVECLKIYPRFQLG
jgi:chromosome segregation ATPase